MTSAEEENRGILTIDVDYLEMAQVIENAMYMLQRVKDKLDIAAIEKGMKTRNRRHGDRRKKNN